MSGPTNRLEPVGVRDWSQANLTTKTNNTEKLTADSKDAGNNTTFKAEELQMDKERFLKEIDKLNDQMKATSKLFRFQYSEEADRFYMEIVDLRSHEVIESIPSEFMMELSVKLKELVGIFIDKKW